MFITGPQVIKQVTGEVVSAEELGGPQAHMNNSGVVHLIAQNDDDAVQLCRRLLSFMPSNNLEDPPRAPFNLSIESDPEMNGLVPVDPKAAYDVREVITRVLDYRDFLEIQPGFAPNIVIGFGRLQGRPVGIIANQPCYLAGVLDINASDKSARFVRFCNAFNIPLITFVDVPGFLPGVEQERGGIIRHGAKLLFAYSAATVPKITVVLRKAYGGAYIAMCSKDLGADRVVAWPTAEVAVMGAEGAAEIVFRREIDAAEDKAGRRQELVNEYRETFSNPFVAAGRRLVDDVIEPADTRKYLAEALESLHTKRELRPAKEAWIDSAVKRSRSKWHSILTESGGHRGLGCRSLRGKLGFRRTLRRAVSERAGYRASLDALAAALKALAGRRTQPACGVAGRRHSGGAKSASSGPGRHRCGYSGQRASHARNSGRHCRGCDCLPGQESPHPLGQDAAIAPGKCEPLVVSRGGYSFKPPIICAPRGRD
jgi:hypothetical protein